ncbi:GDP-mannose 4,6-dehydratase [Patescibacteria group bacterium]
MKKKALITGILGQDGPYLAKLLIEKDYEVYGLIRRYTNPNFENTDYLGVTEKINFLTGDMTDECSLNNIIKTVQPDEVYNLAAQSFVGASWDQPKATTEINAFGTLYLLNAIKNFAPNAKFYQASTSEMFGNSSENGIQTEETPFHPRSPYAIAKLYAYWIAVNYKESYGMYCANGILFNHESPIRGIEFVTRKITDGVARIKLGLAKEIRLGNLDSKRDWGFAGDYVEAMWLMLQQEKADNYILSTGETHSIREFLEIAFNHVGIKDWEKYVTLDPRFQRPAELHTLQGESDKVQEKLNWKPKVGFEELVKMMMDADLERLSKNVDVKDLVKMMVDGDKEDLVKDDENKKEKESSNDEK